MASAKLDTHPKRHVRLAYLAIGAACLVVLSWCTGPIGYVATKMACRKDGGVRIAETVFADGVYLEGPQGECLWCQRLLSEHQFSYVESRTQFRNGSTRINHYSIEAAGDPRCEKLSGSFRLKENECFVVAALDEPMAKYAIEAVETHQSPGPLGVVLNSWGTEIRELGTNRVIGYYRDYGYAPYGYRGFAGGELHSCNIKPSEHGSLVKRVLKDSARK